MKSQLLELLATGLFGVFIGMTSPDVINPIAVLAFSILSFVFRIA